MPKLSYHSLQPYRSLNGKFNHGNLTGAGVAIYIVDTGVFLNHAEFGGAVGPSRAKWGADCTGASSQCLTAFPPAEARAATGDCNGHGTRCAGIAAGRCGSWRVLIFSTIVRSVLVAAQLHDQQQKLLELTPISGFAPASLCQCLALLSST